MRLIGANIGRAIYIGPGSVVMAGTTLKDGVEIGRMSCVYCGTTLGQNVRIGSYSKLNRIKIDDRSLVGERCSLSNAEIGKNSHIETDVRFTGYKDGSISIGSECYIGIGTILDWSGNINIGNNVHIAGPSASFWTHSSVYQALGAKPLQDDSMKIAGPISIGSNCWVGGGAVVYPGVSIGDHTVILPNTVVIKDVPDHTMLGGNPGVPVRRIVDDQGSENGYVMEQFK
ncbi:MAG: hypothetical protein JXK93_08505 [Sphaerochaetaceae bacterium]|nr:hypothetical protein [Sphaerochaetaceae bacterium]